MSDPNATQPLYDGTVPARSEKVERYERVEQAVVNLEYGTGAVGEFVSADTARQLMRELAAERRQYAQCSEALNRALSAREAIIEECADVAADMMEGTVGKDSKYGECRFVVSDALFHCAQSIRALARTTKR